MIAILLILFIACSKETIKKGLPAEELYRASMEALENKKYGKAIEGFKRLVFEHPGSERIDDAQFYLGEAYFASGDYENAVVEYRFLIQGFPESPWIDDATYKLGLTYFKASPAYYLDQRRTQEALRIIERFLDNFPESDLRDEAASVKNDCENKLSRKELENGRLYYKLGHYGSAELYLLDMLSTYPESSHADESRYMLGLCYVKLGREEEAKEIFGELSKDGNAFSAKAEQELDKLNKQE